MDSDVMSSVYAQIVNGTAKTDSRFVTDDESSALWDQIAGEVEALRADGVHFEVPHEVPGEPGTPTGGIPAPGTKPPEAPAPAADEAPAPAEEPPEEPPEPTDTEEGE